jgi:hypothetical protein
VSTHILAQRNATLQQDNELPCEHIALFDGDFQYADCFARSKGFDDTDHLNSIYDALYPKPESQP